MKPKIHEIAEAVTKLAAVLPKCTSLARLDLSQHYRQKGRGAWGGAGNAHHLLTRIFASTPSVQKGRGAWRRRCRRSSLAHRSARHPSALQGRGPRRRRCRNAYHLLSWILAKTPSALLSGVLRRCWGNAHHLLTNPTTTSARKGRGRWRWSWGRGIAHHLLT